MEIILPLIYLLLWQFMRSQDLIDPTTKVTIGEAEVTSNGTDQGGKAKITLKTWIKYLENWWR